MSSTTQGLDRGLTNYGDRDFARYLPQDAIPLPHPSPRNQLWFKVNPWFEAELLPVLRERVAADRIRAMGSFALAPDVPYETFRSLSFESRQKLAAVRPATLAQAAGVPGVSPSDLQNLIVEIERLRRGAAGAIA